MKSALFSDPAQPYLSCREFRDADFAPVVVALPRGEFLMGSVEHEDQRSDTEGPQHLVQIAYEFALGKYAVTFDEWDACFQDGGTQHRPDDCGWGRGRQPVINVSWDDTRLYLAWLTRRSGQTYRLPSESEWEYACRAGTTGPFSFLDPVTADKANYDATRQYAGSPIGVYRKQTVEVGSLLPNPWGLHEMHGNVWEWLEDGRHDHYVGAPEDGSVWIEGATYARRMVRGGAWNYYPQNLRSASRGRGIPDERANNYGFRVVRTFP